MSGAVWRHTVLWMPAIEVQDLFKSYGSVDAVRGISFRVEVGEVFALLGPNGAGKTTTLEILEGHRVRSGGQVSVRFALLEAQGDVLAEPDSGDEQCALGRIAAAPPASIFTRDRGVVAAHRCAQQPGERLAPIDGRRIHG